MSQPVKPPALGWTARRIAGALVRQTFERRHLVIVPECNWTGAEADLLVVTQDLRIIDVEIKISRSDLKADAAKDKWYTRWDWRADRPAGADPRGAPRMWPRRVWKHYYCLPKEIWKPELLECLPSPASGVLLVAQIESRFFVSCARRATPCKDAEKIGPSDAVDIARLASLRMWDAYQDVDRLHRELQEARKA